MLESHLVAATQGPLCLDPNPIPSIATTRLRQSKSLLTDHQLMRQAKKFSQVINCNGLECNCDFYLVCLCS